MNNCRTTICKLAFQPKASYRMLFAFWTCLSVFSQGQSVNPDFRTGITRVSPTVGIGWVSQPFVVGAGDSQSFSNWLGTGVAVTFTYSNNMWDTNAPNIYVPVGATGLYAEPPNDSHPAAIYHGSMRFTNNDNDSAGLSGSATGPTLMSIAFDQPVNLSKCRIGSLSQIRNLAGNIRNEWVRIRVYGGAAIIPLVVGDASHGIIDTSGNSVAGDMYVASDGAGGLILGCGDGNTSNPTGPVQESGAGINDSTYGHFDIVKNGNITKIEIEFWGNTSSDPLALAGRQQLYSAMISELVVQPNIQQGCCPHLVIEIP